jgi:hypothetical protein
MEPGDLEGEGGGVRECEAGAPDGPIGVDLEAAEPRNSDRFEGLDRIHPDRVAIERIVDGDLLAKEDDVADLLHRPFQSPVIIRVGALRKEDIEADDPGPSLFQLLD